MGRLPLGRIHGIPVGAHWSVLMIGALLTQLLAANVLPAANPGRPAAAYWVAGGSTALVFLASLLAHESAHALVAQRRGVRVRRITLWLLGGIAEFAEEPATARDEFRIAVAGPLASAAVAVAGAGAAVALTGVADPLVTTALVWLAASNGVIAVFNLLPGAPLDGGRVLRALLWRRGGDRERATRRAAAAGRVLGTVLALLGVVEVVFGELGGLWLMLLGWFLVAAATAELRASVLRGRLEGLVVRDAVAGEPVAARGWWTVQTFVERTAVQAKHRLYPVVAFDGGPIGVVGLADLTRFDLEERLSVTVAQACRSLPEGARVRSDEPLARVVTRTPLRPGRDLLVVVDEGILTGVVTAEDVERVAARAALSR